MAAFGTKKPGGDMAAQLQFPSVFAEVVAHNPLAYAQNDFMDESSSDGEGGSESDEGMQHPVAAGSHLQDKYHEQKCKDAQAMALASVQARKNSDYRNRHSCANYFNMPKPVLSQRHYANPSNGNQADIYTERPNQFLTGGGGDLCSLRGGVLRTAEGQSYGMKLLRNRVNQYDTIDRNKMSFIASQPTEEETAVEQGLPEQPGTKAMLELNGLMQQISDAVYAGADAVSRFALADMSQALRLLFRVSSIANAEELGDLLAVFADLRAAIPNLEREVNVDEDAGKKVKPPVRTMIQLIRKGYLYVERMLGAVNKSPKDRKRLSATLAKQFTKFGKFGDLAPADERALAADAPDGIDGDDYDEEEDDDDAGQGEARPEGEEGDEGDDNQDQDEGESSGEEEEEEEEEESDEEGAIADAGALYDADAEWNYLTDIKVGYVREYAKRLGIANAIHKTKKTLIDLIEKLPAHARKIFSHPNPYAKPGTKPQSVIIGSLDDVNPDGKAGNKTLRTFGKAALAARLHELRNVVGHGHARGGAARHSRSAAPPHTSNSIFTRPGMSSEYTTQMDSLHQAGLKNVKYDRDERNVFGNKAGAYLGEELPKGGDAVAEGKTSKYPLLKEGGGKFTKAKLREAAAPVFGGSATYGDGLKARLGGRVTGFPDQGKESVYNGTPSAGGKKVKESSNDIVNRNNALAAQRRRAREAMERARRMGKGKAETHGMSRAELPKTREGFVALAEKLKGHGHNIRINSGSSLSNIRQNFIRRLKL